MNVIHNILGTTTVKSIMSDFQEKVDQLNTLKARKEAEHTSFDLQIEDLQMRKVACVAEIKLASSVAAKLQEILRN